MKLVVKLAVLFSLLMLVSKIHCSCNVTITASSNHWGSFLGLSIWILLQSCDRHRIWVSEGVGGVMLRLLCCVLDVRTGAVQVTTMGHAVWLWLVLIGMLGKLWQALIWFIKWCSLSRLVLTGFFLVCVCACIGCGYGYRRRYVVRQQRVVNSVPPPVVVTTANTSGKFSRNWFYHWHFTFLKLYRIPAIWQPVQRLWGPSSTVL